MFSRDTRLTVTQDSICGSFSGILSRTLTAPLDVTKVLYQVGVPHANQRAYLGGGLFSLAKYVKQTEGSRALYKGNMTSCLKMFPASIIQFSTYFSLKTFFAGETGEMTMTQTTLASATAGYASTIVTYPIDTVKTRLIAQPFDKGRSFYRGIIDCWRMMIYTEGVRSLWKGLSAALLATVPSTMSLFLTYELLDRYIFSADVPSVINDCVVDGKRVTHGMTAALISLLSTHPLDTCRKKMQAYSLHLENHGGVDFEVKSLRQCFGHIWRNQWFLGLYAGFAPAALRLVPFNALMLWSYNRCKRLCLRHNGLPAQDHERLLTRREEDIHDLEYMLLEDLLNDDPPAVRYAKLYLMEQQELKENKKKRNKIYDKNEKN
ncbi:solute carrier family 25 member 43-like [Mercenaria mercenaria]|uniref:solute carrier family 25 member 43-like n=1 Tax=Mercenaria mercenaria TaxID=6596 RepID=UPI00234E8876|nr:solute carrier family 25 member 43-like [Mercenaria mercenaria]